MKERSYVYHIRLEGELDERWSDWFSNLAVSHPAENQTLLVGRIADQATLRGILDRIWNLNLVLISVERQE